MLARTSSLGSGHISYFNRFPLIDYDVLQHASESPGDLVKTQFSGLAPEFVIQ